MEFKPNNDGFCGLALIGKQWSTSLKKKFGNLGFAPIWKNNKYDYLKFIIWLKLWIKYKKKLNFYQIHILELIYFSHS